MICEQGRLEGGGGGWGRAVLNGSILEFLTKWLMLEIFVNEFFFF